jgi:hypothetical protein
MDNVENDRQKRFESVYSKKVRAGKRRTYFFDVRRTRGEDFYLTLTESTKRMQGGYERHKVFLYKEDFNRFVQALEETVNYIKTELMPQYDYDEFARRQEEFEARYAEGLENGGRQNFSNDNDDDEDEPIAKHNAEASFVQDSVEIPPVNREIKSEPVKEELPPRRKNESMDDDMSW